MFERYIYHGKEKLRCGYTTGSCATAAAKAAAEMLLTGDIVCSITIMTPKGIALELDVQNSIIENGYALCSVVKDSGDDPDITNGISVFAKAEKISSGVEICGGEGIGTITAKGLDQPVGAAAINSVPRKMIKEAVSEISEENGYYGGFKITVSVPGGEELARKTYNPRMGIEGGISIIGTSGIVEPMSSAALVETIRMEERVRKAQGLKNLLLTIGNYSDDFLTEKMPYIPDKGVKCSNFIGEAIDSALEYGFESILIVGHIGKLVKLGAGIMNTHSAQADGRMDVLVTCGVLAGADIKILRKIPECVTVDAALEIFQNAGILERVSEILMQKTEYYLDAKVKNAVKIGALMFSNKFGIIGQTSSAEELIELITEEYNG